MNFFQRAKFFFGQGFDDYIQRFLAGEDIPDVNHSGQVDSQTAMKYTAVFACIRVLSETLAGTPVMLYRKKENGDRETRNDLAAYDILHNQPNEEMSPFNYKEVAMVALNLGGNTVSQKLVNKYGELIGLYPYEWSKVDITRDLTTSRLMYKIRDGTKRLDLPRDQVFHIAGLQEADRIQRQKESLIRFLSSDSKHLNEVSALLQYATKATMLTSFDGDIFKRFVERIIVYTRTEIGFELKCGITLNERLVK